MSDKEEQETKPDLSVANELLNIKVLGHDSSVVQFKIKKHTPLAKLMKIYCEKMRLNQESVRFMFDGNRITKSTTPESVSMQEGDTLEVFIPQEGGA